MTPELPAAASPVALQGQGAPRSGRLVVAFHGQDKYLYYIRTHGLEPEPTLGPGLGGLERCAEQATEPCSFLGGFISKQLGLEDHGGYGAWVG